MKKCIFFDRDGIVNRAPVAGYVERWADFVLVPEFVEVLRLVRERGYEAVIVSNQRGVARGIMTAEAVDEIHRNLRDILGREHNLEVLRGLPLLASLGMPIMVGPSRKRFLGAITGNDATDRDTATAAACVAAFLGGAYLFRVHDVARVRESLAVAEALRSS